MQTLRPWSNLARMDCQSWIVRSLGNGPRGGRVAEKTSEESMRSWLIFQPQRPRVTSSDAKRTQVKLRSGSGPEEDAASHATSSSTCGRCPHMLACRRGLIAILHPMVRAQRVGWVGQLRLWRCRRRACPISSVAMSMMARRPAGPTSKRQWSACWSCRVERRPRWRRKFPKSLY